jgi:hypothetical protein
MRSGVLVKTGYWFALLAVGLGWRAGALPQAAGAPVPVHYRVDRIGVARYCAGT